MGLMGIGEWPGSSWPLESLGGPNILFLCETKMDKNRIEKFKWKLGMTNTVAKNCVFFLEEGYYFHFPEISRYYIDEDVEKYNGFT